MHSRPSQAPHLHNAFGIQSRQLRHSGVEDALPCAAQPHGGGNLAGHEARDGDVCRAGVPTGKCECQTREVAPANGMAI